MYMTIEMKMISTDTVKNVSMNEMSETKVFIDHMVEIVGPATLYIIYITVHNYTLDLRNSDRKIPSQKNVMNISIFTMYAL